MALNTIEQTNKQTNVDIDRRDVTEILLKVALNTIKHSEAHIHFVYNEINKNFIT